MSVWKVITQIHNVYYTHPCTYTHGGALGGLVGRYEEGAQRRYLRRSQLEFSSGATAAAATSCLRWKIARCQNSRQTYWWPRSGHESWPGSRDYLLFCSLRYSPHLSAYHCSPLGLLFCSPLLCSSLLTSYRLGICDSFLQNLKWWIAHSPIVIGDTIASKNM